MPLTIESRRAGDIVVVKCAGRLVAGAECDSLHSHLTEILPYDRHIVLDLGEVPFIDSSGIGTLVRLLARTKAAHGRLKLSNVPDQVTQVLELTKLQQLFESNRSATDAITELHLNRQVGAEGKKVPVLCVHTSSDLLAFVRELLNGAGFDAITATNLLDARALMAAVRPSTVVVSAKLNALTGTQAADGFRALIAKLPVVELDDNFVASDPARAAAQLLDRVRASQAEHARGAVN